MREEVVRRRWEKARQIDLEDAVEVLEERALKVTIPCSRQILRVLLELRELRQQTERPRRVRGDSGPEAGTWRIVEPLQRNPVLEHVQAPEDDGPTTCGVDPQGWIIVDEVGAGDLTDVLERDRLCDRCRQACRARYFGGAL